MLRLWAAAFAFMCLSAGAAPAQEAGAVVQAASRAMGIEGLNAITYYGVGQTGNLGQNNNANQPWPLVGANDYVRTIDFTRPASRATWSTYAMTVQGAPATLVQGQLNVTPQNNAWAQQLEIWVTPWGFLKGAAANGATVKAETINGRAVNVVSWNAPIKSPGGQNYRLVGTINSDNLVERVQTWVEHSIFGDMLVETDYTFYRDNNGLKYPSRIEQRRAGWPTFQAYILGAHANPPNITVLMTPPAGAAPAGPPPAAAANAPRSEQLAKGVWRINGAYNAMAVEFADYVLIFEPGPQNEARAQAIIAETRRLVPRKPIRYGVISHHHADHTGGLEAVAAEGITIVTTQLNKPFLEAALNAPRTLAPDALAKSGRKPMIEGFAGDLRVFEDRTRRFEVHLIKGLPHADGLVIGYLPRERILVYADMFNIPPASDPVPNPPVVGSHVFLDNIERLKLKPDRLLSVHAMVPDRLTTVAEIRASLGR